LANARAFGGFMALAGNGFETRLPPHVHSAYVLGVVDQGSVWVTVDGSSYLAVPGSVILIAPFVVHTELPEPGGWSFRYLYPSEAVVRSALGIHGDGQRAFDFAHPVLHNPAMAAAIARVHDRVRHDPNEMRESDEFVRLVRLLRDSATRAPVYRPPIDRRNIHAVRDMLTERPVRNVRLGDLADAAGLSQFHFARVFKSEIGLPPYAYFEQVRIAHAHDLILQGHDLPSVAYQLGYADQSHLTRHFHRGSFTTPGHLAQLARNAGKQPRD
jgi:AraC-like DNA-binding protein